MAQPPPVTDQPTGKFGYIIKKIKYARFRRNVSKTKRKRKKRRVKIRSYENISTANSVPVRSEKPALDGLLKEVSVTVDGQFLAERPAQIRCHKCGNDVLTRVDASSSIGSWIGCFILWGCCLCCLPFFLDQFKIHEHTCPSCNTQIGVHKGMLSLSS